MTTIRTAAVALVALVSLLLGSAIANGAAGVKIVNFSAKYNGTATVKVTGEVVDSIAAKGTGTGVPIGRARSPGSAKVKPSSSPATTGAAPVSSRARRERSPSRCCRHPGCGDEEGNFFSIVGGPSSRRPPASSPRQKGT